MKKIALLLAVISLGVMSCKKETTIINCSFEEVQPQAGEDYNVSDEFIKANKFIILKAYNNQGNKLQAWKLKAVNVEKYVYVEGNLTYWFWRDGYRENDIIDGKFVLTLPIKK